MLYYKCYLWRLLLWKEHERYFFKFRLWLKYVHKETEGEDSICESNRCGLRCRSLLTFDKVSNDGSGKCDIEPTTNLSDRVWGVLFEIDQAEKSALDSAAGLGNGYREESLLVIKSDISHEALSYVATNKAAPIRPYHCPEPYIEWLRTVESVGDPNIQRCAKKEALLFEK